MARIRPDWIVIGLKIWLSLLLIYFVPVGRELIGKTLKTTRFMIGFVGKYAKELITESKGQNKSWRANRP